MRLPDTFCPECHGDYRLLFVRKECLSKQCLECGHKWLEEPEATASDRGGVREGNWIDRGAAA